MKKAFCIILLCAAMILAGCSKQVKEDNQDALHIGLDAEIVELDLDNQYIYVKSADQNSNRYFGERCKIDCSVAVEKDKVVYADHSKPIDNNLSFISLNELQVGDRIILGIYDSQLNNPKDGAIIAEQIELDTQREKPLT